MPQRFATSERDAERDGAAAPPVHEHAGATPRQADNASLLLARSLAFVCKNLCSESNQLLSIGRFELLRTLGRGGMGVVYEAYDPLRRERLALKTLYGRTPEDLYLLKREFRSLAALRHANLVALHELSVAAGEAHFTMELVHGRDFLSYVRDGQVEGAPPIDLAKLRSALAQLAAGVHALHRAGKLHGDLKPSNVLVDDAGRVVLLDFGLVRDARDRDDITSGTAAYMAPEQAAGSPSESSDWYSFGLILRQALYGRSELRTARTGQSERPPASSQRALEQLAAALTERDPAQRPRYRDIEELIDPAPSASTRTMNAQRTRAFIGRAAELAALRRAFADSKARPAILLVRGESGIGKSALLRRFIDVAIETDEALVFSGRCYERESIPFKALDDIVDRLSHHLAALPEAETRALCPAHADALVRLFPVLGRIAAFAIPSGNFEDVHPVELRRRAGEALRELLCNLAARQPLVLSIDDLQWSDADSGQLLAAILCDEQAPPVLVLGSDRSDPWQINPAISAFQRASELAFCSRPIGELILERLSEADAEQLARGLIDHPRSEGAALVRLVVRESAGNPLLLIELARTLRARANGALRGLEHCTLASVFAERLRQLDAQSRLLLELVVVAGRPIPLSTLARAARLERLPYAEVAALRSARLVHVLPREGDELIELDNDRVGEAVLRAVDAGARKELHARLARAFEAAEGDHDDVLFDQYLGADLRAEAAQHARKAADSALALLAFSRAAWLYEQALTCAVWSSKEQGQMQRALATALDHSGRALEAAAAYQRAAALQDDPMAALLLEERAARHLLHNGRAEEGFALLQRAFATLELHWPASRGALLLGMGRQLLPAPLRRFSLRRKRASAALQLARAEYLAEAGRGVEGYYQLRSMYNALVCVDAAEQSECPIWQTRASGGRAFFRCIGLAQGAAEAGLRELELACARADELGDVHARADLGRQLACAHLLLGDARSALDVGNRNESLLRSLPLVAYDLQILMAVIGSALLDLGEIHELRRRWTAFAHAAQHHNDAMTAFWIHTHPVQFALFFANGDRRGAELALETQAQQRRLLEDYGLLAWAHAYGRIETELYWGSASAGVALARTERRTLLRSGQPFLTAVARHLSARAALALASSLPPGKARSRLLRCAEREAARVERPLRGRKGTLLQLQADIALLRGDPQRALALLDRALVELERGGHKLLAACARHCRGALLAGEGGATLQREALTSIAASGVAEPLRWVLWMAPAFRSLNGSQPG